MGDQTTLLGLLQGVQFQDPRLATLLSSLINEFYAVKYQLNPPSATTVFANSGIQLPVIDSVEGFISTTFSNNLRLTWDAVASLLRYEIRYIAGNYTETAWDTAQEILTTTTLVANINPLEIPLTAGNHTFLIKALDSGDNESTTAAYLVVNIAAIQTPAITVSVINNFVLLKWLTPTSTFAVDYYNIYKDSVFIGRVYGTFDAIFETLGGTYTYAIEAVDIVGNISARASVVVILGNPAEFVLQGSLTSAFTGTKTNCKTELVGTATFLIACINTTKTFENHFIDNSWTTPQAQIDAGYPYYIQPGMTTGEYVEVFNFGAIFTNVIVSVAWNILVINGVIGTTTSTIEVSDDDITYSSPVTATSTFVASVRYVRFKFKLTASDTKQLAYFYNLQCLLNVRYEADGGVLTCNSGDSGGTTATFNKAFKSVSSITLDPKSTSAVHAVHDFTYSTVNPTTFKILVFDAAGARATADVAWLARGILA